MHERHLEEEEEEVRPREAAILLFIFLYVINKELLSHEDILWKRMCARAFLGFDQLLHNCYYDFVTIYIFCNRILILFNNNL